MLTDSTMRTHLVLLALVGSTLFACGTPVPDIAPPPARGSMQVSVEEISLDELGRSAVLLATDHAAWTMRGEVSWIDATGRGVLPLPSLSTDGGPSPVRAVDAQGGDGFALMAGLGDADSQLFALSSEGARPLPQPSGVTLRVGDVRLLRWAPGVLVMTATPISSDEAPWVCVFEHDSWRCSSFEAVPGRWLEVHGRDPADPTRVAIEVRGPTVKAPTLFTFDVNTGAFEPRKGDAADVLPLPLDARVQRSGRPALRVERQSTTWARGCFDPDGRGRLRVLCREQGAVTDFIFSEEVAGEVGHARIEMPMGPIRELGVRHPTGDARVFGDFLVALARIDGVIVRLP